MIKIKNYFMKIIILFSVFFLLINCSFDNKSGIWNNENNVANKNEIFKQFKSLSSIDLSFNKIIPINENFKFNNIKRINPNSWNDIFYQKDNNYLNFALNTTNEVSLKSQKITRNSPNEFILFNNNNVIVTDNKGNIIVYSIENNKIISKYNFYKKKYKNIKKKLNIIIENKIIFVSDNLGYLYAFDYEKNKLIWAKNYKIPFRSNLKIFNNKLIAANQNNNLYFFDKNIGSILKLIPTEETIVKNEFINNLSLKNKFSYFLNTYGSLYSIENESFKINWFINLNQTLNLNPSSIFKGNQIINNEKFIIASSNKSTYILDSRNGAILFKKNFSSEIKPLLINNYLFIVTKNNLLICMDLNEGKIIYSYDINQKIAEFLKIKKKGVEFKTLMMGNNEILIFLKNSYILKFKITGDLIEIVELPSKIKTHPIIVQKSILYLNNKNKIVVIN